METTLKHFHIQISKVRLHVFSVLLMATSNFSYYEGRNFNSGNYLFTTDTK